MNAQTFSFNPCNSQGNNERIIELHAQIVGPFAALVILPV